MKSFTSIIILSLTIILFISNCSKQKEDQEISGRLISNSECKHLKSANTIPIAPDSVTSISYTYDASKHKLMLNHINAGFNCCPDSLYCSFSLTQDTIIIQEFEKSLGCKCNCLYDLEIEVTGVDKKIYQIKFIEPLAGEQQKIIFEMDLTKNNTGSYSVIRKQYPWG